MTPPTPIQYPIEIPHVMTPEAMKRFAAAYYQGQAALAQQEAKRQ